MAVAPTFDLHTLSTDRGAIPMSLALLRCAAARVDVDLPVKRLADRGKPAHVAGPDDVHLNV